jgi:DNA-binding response OmpR family regulator
MKKILLVDDDYSLSFELEQLFKDEYIVDKSVDGMAALGKVNAELYDCVILDVDILGGADGLQVLKAVKSQERTKKTPVVMLTNSGIERKQEFLDAGADEYLVKGEMNLPELKELVGKFANTTLTTQQEES